MIENGGTILDSRQVNQAARGKLAGSVALAILIGAVLPFAAVFQISLLMPMLMLGGIFATYIKVRDGWIPVGALFAAALGVSLWAMGPLLTLVWMTASLLPALAVMRAMERKAPFFEQLRLGICAWGSGLLLAILIAYMSFGGGMIVRFIDLLRTEYSLMPDGALQPLVDWINALLPAAMPGAGAGMTVADFRVQISGMLDLLQQAYAQILPGAMLSGALLSGIVAVLWGNWAMARRGRATNESFVGMSRWFMPAEVAIGGVALWLAGLVLMNTGAENGATIYMTIAQTVGAAFAVQALCALDRRLMRAGRELKGRRVPIVLLAVAGVLIRGVGSVLAYVGAASALFGSHGAISGKLRSRRQDHSDDNDSDE